MKTGSSPIMNPALRDFWLTQSRFKILYGGRGSSKSWDAAANSVRIANEVKIRVLCTRMFQNRIEESVYTLIKKQINRFGLSSRFKILNNKIINRYTGSEFIFYGLARNIEEVKSLEGIDIWWNEEAHSLTSDIWEVLEPTIRKESSEIWQIFNPKLATDFAYKKFVLDPPKNALIRKINYNENPFLSQTLLDTINELKEKDYQAYEHIYLGEPKSNDEDVIIKRSWVNAAIDAHLKLGIEKGGGKITGYDVADAGEDKNSIVNRNGIIIEYINQWQASEDELMKSSQKAYEYARTFKSTIVYDSIGLGAMCGSKFSELNTSQKLNISYKGFNAGGKVVNPDKEYKHGVKNKDQFSNVKAQAWWLVADRFRNTYDAVVNGNDHDSGELISISSGCNYLEELVTELSTPKKDYDGSLRVKVESKKEMKKRGIPSPNIADALIMCFAPFPKTNKIKRRPMSASYVGT